MSRSTLDNDGLTRRGTRQITQTAQVILYGNTFPPKRTESTIFNILPDEGPARMSGDIFEASGLESIGVWDLDADIVDELDIEWTYGDHTVTVSPADASSPATARATYSKPHEAITVWETEGEWTAVLQETRDWLQQREHGPVVESEKYATDNGAWKHELGEYTPTDEGYRPVIHWVDDSGSETRAAVRPRDGQYAFLLVDYDIVLHGESGQEVVITTGDIWGTLEHAVGWMNEHSEGVSLERKETEFSSREMANRWRDKLPPHAITHRDDRRKKTLEFYPQLVDDIQLNRLEMDAAEGMDQEPLTRTSLTEHEVERVRNKAGYDVPQDRFKAMWVKSLAMQKGIRDWTAYFDPSLSVEEHRGTLDTADTWGEVRTMAKGSSSVKNDIIDENRLQENCFNGDLNACEILLEHTEIDEQELVSRAYDNDAVDSLEGLFDEEKFEELREEVKEEKIGILDEIDKELARALDEIEEGDRIRVDDITGVVKTVVAAETKIASVTGRDREGVYYVEQTVNDEEYDNAVWSVAVDVDEEPIFVEFDSHTDDNVIPYGVAADSFRADEVVVAKD